ncbi:MAG: O-antigen ligase family protein [Bifidobacteriaceae bacterium]|jgi:O-antigen ligase|nr:O-antigen ligase family protein [Bifidobacteriaceae bacterium]
MLDFDWLLAAFPGNRGFLWGSLLTGLVFAVVAVWLVVRQVRRPAALSLPVVFTWLTVWVTLPSSWIRMNEFLDGAHLTDHMGAVYGAWFSFQCLMVALLVAMLVFYGRRWRSIGLPAWALVAAWLAVLVASAAAGKFAAEWVFGIAVVVALAVSPLRGEALLTQARWIMRALLLGSVIWLIVATPRALRFGSEGLVQGYDVRGLTYHPNVLALIAAISLLFEVKAFRLRSASLFWLALGAANLVMTGSRTGWVAALSALVVLAVVSGRTGCLRAPWLRWAVPAGLVVAAGAAAAIAAKAGYDRINAVSTRRLEIWSETWPHLWDHLPLGRGMHPYSASDLPPILFDYQVSTAHNQFLETGLDSGLPGLACLALLIGAMVWAAIDGRAYRDLRLALLVALLADMVVETPLVNPLQYQSCLTPLVVVLLCTLGRGQARGQTPGQARRLSWLGSTPTNNADRSTGA